jgi:hypothetical protein
LAGHEQRLTALRSAHPSTPRKDIMNREKILIEHWRWLQVNGTSNKPQAASAKQQA